MRGLLSRRTKCVLVVLSLSVIPLAVKAAELYRYRVDGAELVFTAAADPKQEAIADDNIRVRKAMLDPNSKTILEIGDLADTWAARYYQIPVTVGEGITCNPVHWLIDYQNAKGDGQTYYAVLLPNGTIVEPHWTRITDIQLDRRSQTNEHER